MLLIFPVFRKARPFFLRVLLRLTLWQKDVELKTVTIVTPYNFPVFHPPYSCYFLQLLIVIVNLRLLHCNVIYLAHAYILNFQISNCNVFVYVTLAFLRYPIVGQSQTYPEEERPCLSKYWNGKIYFPNREISLALIIFVLPYNNTKKQVTHSNTNPAVCSTDSCPWLPLPG